MSAIVDELAWRGLLQDVADEAALRRITAQPTAVYLGCDPTAPSLHIGHLQQVLVLARFQRLGHRPIALVGGATGLIGDPGGRSEERVLNDAETVRGWVERIGRQLAPFLDFAPGPAQAVLVDNLDWTGDVSAISFLRDVGKHFPISVMLAKDSVKSRLGRDGGGITFTEFSYMLLQAWDFLRLAEDRDCRIQFGGSDQWGNITAGLDLIRRVRPELEASAFTSPLITKANGEKFGKTAGGAVWLDPALTTPYAFYQFWLNAEDAMVGTYLARMTFLGREEIDGVVAEHALDPGRRAGQRRLAEEVTRIVHGEDGLARARAVTHALFGSGDLRELPLDDLLGALEGVPSCTVAPDESPTLAEVVHRAGLADSRSDAARLAKGGGISVNGVPVDDLQTPVDAGMFLHGAVLVLRRGKRVYGLATRP